MSGGARRGASGGTFLEIGSTRQSSAYCQRVTDKAKVLELGYVKGSRIRGGPLKFDARHAVFYNLGRLHQESAELPMKVLTRAQIRKATSPSPWDLTNTVLYDLCRVHPGHRAEDAVLAKVLLIGRSYAAAIERRKEKDGTNDDFYLSKVAPSIIKSGIDRWIAQARVISPKSPDSLDAMVEVHAKTTELFRSISGLNKRSLASKYLHFHVPRLFFIYDTRAVLGMRALSGVVGRAVRSTGSGDNEYRKFAEKCLRLQRACKDRSGAALNPREIDNLLLAIAHEGARG